VNLTVRMVTDGDSNELNSNNGYGQTSSVV
jgi:hypothetical protein